jgi:hypothetical protein
VRDNGSVRSSFHSTVTTSVAGFLHSPLSAVKIARLFALHTNPSSKLIPHDAFSRVTGDSKRRLQDNVRCFHDSAPETYFACKNSFHTFPDIFFPDYREVADGIQTVPLFMTIFLTYFILIMPLLYDYFTCSARKSAVFEERYQNPRFPQILKRSLSIFTAFSGSPMLLFQEDCFPRLKTDDPNITLLRYRLDSLT